MQVQQVDGEFKGSGPSSFKFKLDTVKVDPQTIADSNYLRASTTQPWDERVKVVLVFCSSPWITRNEIAAI